MIATQNNFLEKNKDLIKNILTSITRSTKNFIENKEKSIKLIEEKCNLSYEDSKLWIENVDFSVNGDIDFESMKNVLKTLKDLNLINNLENEINFENIFIKL
jgi:hypothetical protein